MIFFLMVGLFRDFYIIKFMTTSRSCHNMPFPNHMTVESSVDPESRVSVSLVHYLAHRENSTITE